MARGLGAWFSLQAASGGEKHIAKVEEDGCMRRGDAALHDVAHQLAPGFDDAARSAAAEPAAQSSSNEVAVLVGVKPAEGEPANAGKTAAASSPSEMVAACIIFASAFSGLSLSF